MTLFIIFCFSCFIIASCIFTARFGAKWNLKACVAVGSGALLSICFLDFLPHSFEDSKLDEMISICVLLGILVQTLADVYLLPHLDFLDKLLKIEASPNREHQHAHTFSSFSTCSIVGCLSLCSFFDGIRLFSALNIDNFVAFSMVFGLFFHLLSEGVLIAILAMSSGFKKQILFVLSGSVAIALFLGALFAQIFSQNFSLDLLIAFSSGCLIYICFVHLLPVSLKLAYRNWFFIGLFVFSILHFLI
ncbi:MAG: hypothetical protein OXC37_00045 [Bdellovibrionaceae bacterium]|nr:hypothetical protein [Pseudobdellovibrionaceae bacterium]